MEAKSTPKKTLKKLPPKVLVSRHKIKRREYVNE